MSKTTKPRRLEVGGIRSTAVTVPSRDLGELSEHECRAVQYIVLAAELNPTEMEFKVGRGDHGSSVAVTHAASGDEDERQRRERWFMAHRVYVDDESGDLFRVPSSVPSAKRFEQRIFTVPGSRRAARIKDKILLYGTGELVVNGVKLSLITTLVERYDRLTARISIDGAEARYHYGDTVSVGDETYKLEHILLRSTEDDEPAVLLLKNDEQPEVAA
jgi:hypothetical protein